MATVLFLAGGQAQAGPSFSMDCYTEITSSFTSRTTKHPVEGGADITDHVIEENATFQLKGYVSNTPIPKANPNWPGTIPTEGADRVSTAYSELKKLRRSRAPFTLVTSLDTFVNCVIVGMNIEESSGKSSDDVLEVSLDIEQIRVVASESIIVGVAATLDIPDQKKSGSGSIKAAISRTERWLGGSGFLTDLAFTGAIAPFAQTVADVATIVPRELFGVQATPINTLLLLGEDDAAN